MILPNDFCRCEDAGCSEREECLRWVDRENGYNRCKSLFPYDQELGTPCPNRIPVEEEE